MSNIENFFGEKDLLNPELVGVSLVPSLDNNNIFLDLKSQNHTFSDPFNQKIELLLPPEKDNDRQKDKRDENDRFSLFPSLTAITNHNTSLKVNSLNITHSKNLVSTETKFLLGDADRDCDLDRDDLHLIVAARNTNATGIDDTRDLDRDGRITVLDARKLIVILQNNTDFTAPDLSARLIKDTAPNNSTNNDGITSKIGIQGSVIDASDFLCLKAGLDDTSSENFVSIDNLIKDDGSFILTGKQLAELNGGKTLSQGEHTLNLIAKDKWGNESETSVTFIFDRKNPIITTKLVKDTGIKGDGITSDPRIKGRVKDANEIFSFRVGLAGQAVEDYIDFTDILKPNGSFVLNNARLKEINGGKQLADGDYTFNFIATDIAGNQSKVVPFSFTLDRGDDGKVPILNAVLANDTGGSNTDRITLDPTITGQIASDRPIVSLQGSLNGGNAIDLTNALNPNNGRFTLSLEQYEALSNNSLPDGNYTVTLQATDDRGGKSLPFNVTFTLDRTPPPLTLELAPESDTGIIGDGRTTERNVNLIGKTDPDRTVILVETQQSVTADSQGNFTFTNVPMPRAGEEPFTVVATDLAGNQGRLREEFVREGINSAPTITSTPDLTFDTTQQTTYTYQIVATDPDRDILTYTLLDAPEGAEIDENGLISFIPSGILQPFYDFTIEVSDGRGGTDTQSFRLEPQFQNNPPEIVSQPIQQLLITPGGKGLKGEFWDTVDVVNIDAALATIASRDPDATFISTLVDYPNGNSGPFTGFGPPDLASDFTLLSDFLGVDSPSLNGTNSNLEGSVFRFTGSIDISQSFDNNLATPEIDILFSVSSDDGFQLNIDGQTVSEFRDLRFGGVTSTTVSFDAPGNYDLELIYFENFNFTGVELAADFSDLSKEIVPTNVLNLPLDVGVFPEYLYDVEAIDSNQDPLTYSLLESPTGATIDAQTGEINWTPNQLGLYDFTVQVNDGRGGIDTQEFTVEVATNTENVAPFIISQPVTSAVPDVPYRYEIKATDANGDNLTYALLDAPNGMEIDENGIITWNPDLLGTYDVAIAVSDGRGGIANQNYTITVGADTEAPKVNLGLNSTVIQLGEELDLQVAATDNVGVEEIDLLFNGAPVTLNPDLPNQINTASIILNQAGVFEVLATATDASGNIGTKTLQVRVIDPNDNQAPFVEIDPNQFNSASPVITDLTNLLGTVTDDNLEFYRVDIAPVSLVNINNPGELDADYTTIATGNSNVVSNALGQIDPFILRNDSYFVRVYAQDFSGNIGVQGLVLGVDTQTKPGEFSLEFTDLAIPLTGIPIEITRNYSSLDAKFPGDFGYGWSLGLQDAQIQESVPVSPLELQGVPALFGGSDPFQVGTRIYLNTPEGRRVGFTFDPIAEGGIFGTIWRPRFRPDPGVYETLQVEDIPLQQRADGTFGLYLFGLPYNPRDYQLTTRDGTVYNYDQFEGLETVRDRNGNTLTFTNDGITSSTGEEIDFVRDAQGRITEIIDPEGESIIYEYDANGDLIGVTDRTENETTFKYEDEIPHYLTEVIDPLGRRGTKTEYDDRGKISRIIDADGNAIELNFDSATRVQTLTDPFGNNTTFFFDDRGNLVREINAEGGETTRTYDDNNNIITETDARGNTTSFTYDAKGNVLTQTDALGNTTTSTYNQFSQLLTRTDALSNVTTNQYNANGNLLQTTDASGNITAYAYDSFGNLIQVTDASGNITTYAYDPFGRVNQITDADGGVTNLAYDFNGNVTSITTPRRNTTIFAYDDENRLTRITDALGNISTIEYNNAGQRSATVDALGRRTEFIYSDRGLLTQIRYADGTVETFVYDALDRQIATSDRNGNQTQFQYDGVGDLIGVIDALNQQTTYERDAEGNLIRQTDALGRTTTFVYDALNRLTSTTLPLDQVATNTYDAVGNLIRTEDFNGGVLEYDYDGVGNLTQISTENGTVLEQYDYSPTGQVERIEDERGVTLFEYDGLDRITERTDPDGRTIAYTYDADGNVDTLTTASGTVDYNYDALGRLDTVTDRDGAVTDYDYDAVGNLTETNFANGITETREYDLNNRVTNLTTNSNGTVLASYQYTFDNVGNRLSVTENTGRVTQYTYDDLYRVTEEQITDPTLGNDTISYQYDSVGNRLTKTDENGETSYIYDDNDRLIREEVNGQVITYNYDDAGNLIDKRVNGIIVEAYDWNIQGELIRATVNNGSTTTTAEYEYNTDGIRVSKTVNGVETRYLIDEVQQQFDQVIEEYSPNGLIQVVYTHGLDLISQTRGSDKSYYHTDSLGTVRLLTDNSGNVVNRYLYDAYGNILTQSEVQQNSYKFTGEQFDPELNSYYQRARYYNPSTGRFTSRDSFEGFLERPLSLSDYLYAEANSVNRVDPNGDVSLFFTALRLQATLIFVTAQQTLFRNIIGLTGGRLLAQELKNLQQKEKVVDTYIKVILDLIERFGGF